MKKLKQILSKVLKIDENQITEGTSVNDVETWDSFNHLMIVSEIENQLGIKLTMNEVNMIKSYKDIENIVKSKSK